MACLCKSRTTRGGKRLICIVHYTCMEASVFNILAIGCPPSGQNTVKCPLCCPPPPHPHTPTPGAPFFFSPPPPPHPPPLSDPHPPPPYTHTHTRGALFIVSPQPLKHPESVTDPNLPIALPSLYFFLSYPCDTLARINTQLAHLLLCHGERKGRNHR